jgi:hypothetical protein
MHSNRPIAALSGLCLILFGGSVSAQPPEPKRLLGNEAGKASPGPITNVSSPTSGDLVYFPIAPCRIYDSRANSGFGGQGTGPIQHNTSVAIQVTDFGTHEVCGIPFPAAKAAMINVIAVAPNGAGDLRMWAWDTTRQTPPTSSVLNFASVTGLNLANGIIAPLCDTATATGGDCAFDAFFRPDVANTHVVIDVLGYFAAGNPHTLSCMVADNTQGAPANQFTSMSSESCPSGFTLTDGGWFASSPGAVLDAGSSAVFQAPYPDIGQFWTCNVSNVTGTAVNVTCRAVCCQTGPTAVSQF